MIQIYYYNTFCNKISENIVYHSLESNLAINHTKEHYQRFEKSVIYYMKSYFLFII